MGRFGLQEDLHNRLVPLVLLAHPQLKPLIGSKQLTCGLPVRSGTELGDAWGPPGVSLIDSEVDAG